MTIAVCIPTIPPRRVLLARAIASVNAQTLLPDEIIIESDEAKEGAAVTRNRAWRQATADRIAFLDDDDELHPDHLEKLNAFMDETGADMVFAWFEVIGGTDPFPQHFGRTWTIEDPFQTTITCLWKREALERIDGFPEMPEGCVMPDGNREGEDFAAVMLLAYAGGKIMHLPEVTWIWHHHASNTSGLPTW